MPKVSRVATDADGTPYVITLKGGQVYFLNSNNSWVRIPGCARDIAIGRGGEIWKIGCDARSGGYGIWKLFCDKEPKCKCYRGCNRFRKVTYSSIHKDEDVKTCFWMRIEGGGIKLDVDPNGNPWIVADNFLIYYYDGSNWKPVTGFEGDDIAVSNEGVVFAAGLQSKIGRLICPEIGTWQVLSGAAAAITSGPYSIPFIADGTYMVYTTAKREVN